MLLSDAKSLYINGNKVKEVWYGGSKAWSGEKTWELIKTASNASFASFPTERGTVTGGYEKYKVIMTFSYSGVTACKIEIDTNKNYNYIYSVNNTYGSKTVTIITDLKAMTYEMTGAYTTSGTLDSYPSSIGVTSGAVVKFTSLEMYGLPE